MSWLSDYNTVAYIIQSSEVIRGKNDENTDYFLLKIIAYIVCPNTRYSK